MQKLNVFLAASAVLGALCYGAATAQHRLDLATTATDVVVIGNAKMTKTGHALAVGDVNGDAFQDIIVGAPGLGADSQPGDGLVYVIFGSGTLADTVDYNTGSPDLEITGMSSHGGFGTAVAAADVNGDTLDDLIIGAPGVDTVAGENKGTISIFFGSAALPPALSSLDAQVTVEGESALDEFGETVATGDFNNDGIADIIVGDRLADPPGRPNGGKVFILFGRQQWPATLDLSNQPADISIFGPAATQFMGNAVACADLNADDKDDLIIGDFKADPGGFVDAGKTYVIFGSDTLQPIIDLATRTSDITITGTRTQEHSSIAVATGDFDGDGEADLLIGARRADDPGQAGFDVGKVFVFWGNNQRPAGAEVSNDSADVALIGDRDGENLGFALAAGDANADGITDLLIGAPLATSAGRARAGSAYFVLGKPRSDPYFRRSVATAELIIDGAQPSDALGSAVAMGDLNRDGHQDIIVAAEDAAPAGRVYIILGSPTTAIDGQHTVTQPPAKFQLHQNYPNPFNASTVIAVGVPSGAHRVAVAIFNVQGQQIARLFDGIAQPGTITLQWDGRDMKGKAVGSGVYFFVLHADDSVALRRKLVFLK